MYIHETTHSQSTSFIFSTSEAKPRCFTQKKIREEGFSHIFLVTSSSLSSKRTTSAREIRSSSQTRRSFVLSRVVVFCEHSLVVVVENEQREEQTVCVVFEEKGERVKKKCFEAKARR